MYFRPIKQWLFYTDAWCQFDDRLVAVVWHFTGDTYIELIPYKSPEPKFSVLDLGVT